jgi:hypothetical protein
VVALLGTWRLLNMNEINDASAAAPPRSWRFRARAVTEEKKPRAT